VIAGAEGCLPFIEVSDAAAATVAALERGQPGHVYNVVDDEAAPLSELVRTLAAGVGAPPPRELPVWLVRVLPLLHAIATATMRVSNDKAKRVLAWHPRFPTWREGVAHIVDALSHAAAA
jgi:nucleoside-diphosphate-sugar epimerase